jgi:peptidoglycan/LPS O-acetylase OafA/YrhL
LHVSKYPPSLAFTALELGLMCVIMAALFVLARQQGDDVNENNPVLVFGQTAFFFYVMHIFILEVSARTLDMHMAGGLGTSTIATIISLVLLYPICRWYRSYKSAHPKSVVRYL